MINLALACVRRGWYVFPCWPESKKPMTAHGWQDATIDETQVQGWWEQTPNANIAIACGPSNLAVLDIDHGLPEEDAAALAWLISNHVPPTFTVRTGRRPEIGLQLYYTGRMRGISWKLDGCSGEVRSEGQYVMAAGSIHPDTKEAYKVERECEPVPLPDFIRELKPEKVAADLNAKVTESRNIHMIAFLGKLRGAGFTDEMLREWAMKKNAEDFDPPLDEEELERLIQNACKFSKGEPVAFIGEQEQPKEPVDWRELFHSKQEALNAPPVTFLIKDFLQREGVTAIAGPVRERKSLIALNVAHALITGEKLFDHFEVVRKPARVLYLCPEVSLGPFTDRLKRIGLMDYVGDTLFYRTLSADGHIQLEAPELLPALPGSVVILDTAIRFLEGDENSSQDVRAFADSIFALLRNGSESVVMLHHSPKNSGDGMSLENMMRGSGDMGAFLCCCWGTRLQDPERPYQTASFMSNLKQRDFESTDFELTGTPDCRLHYVESDRPVTLKPRSGNRGNKDGKDGAAEALIRAHPGMPIRKLEAELAAHGIKRGTTWISKARSRIHTEAGTSLLAG